MFNSKKHCRLGRAPLVLLSCLSLVTAGDFDANCQFSTEWLKHQSDWSSVVWADLSKCQQDTLGLPANKITLGGKGGSSSIGIDLGSGGDGCDGGTDCMEMCQTLCCASKDCDIAMVHKDTETSCEVSCDIYKEGTCGSDVCNAIRLYWCNMAVFWCCRGGLLQMLHVQIRNQKVQIFCYVFLLY